MQADRFRWLLSVPRRPLSPVLSPFLAARAHIFANSPRSSLHISAVLSAKKKRAMPPKKAPAPEKKTLLGRPGNNLKIGIVGPFQLSSPSDRD